MAITICIVCICCALAASFNHAASFECGIKIPVMYSPPTNATAASEAALETSIKQLTPNAIDG